MSSPFYQKIIFFMTCALLIQCGATPSNDQRQDLSTPESDAAGQPANATPSDTPSTSQPPTDQTWTQTLDEHFPEVESELAFLDHGMDFLKARMEMIAAAKESIRLQTFTIWDDETGRIVVSELIKKAREGVDIKVILDPVQNFSIDRQVLYQRMISEGIQIQGYAPLYTKFIDRFFKGDESTWLEELNMRYHDKLMIVDSEIPEAAVAITGGANIGNPYFRVTPEDPEWQWRDRDVMVRGPVVERMRFVFDRTFSEFEERFRDSLPSWANIALGAFTNPEPLLENSKGLDRERLAWIQNELKQPLSLTWTPATMRFISSRPRFDEDYIHPTYIDAIQKAQSEILILNSYFLPNDEILDALSAAVRRGIDVTILANHAKAIDFPVVQTLTRSYYKEILDMNALPGAQGQVRIFEWLGDGVLGNGEGQNHSKYAIFDAQTGIVGSYNLDPRSQNYNSESILLFSSEASAKPFHDEFHSFLDAGFSAQITYEEAEEYFRPRRLRDALVLDLAKVFEFLL